MVAVVGSQGPPLEYWEVVVSLGAAAILGGIIGLQREFEHKQAGVATHALVTLGSTLVMIISAYGFQNFTGGNLGTYDPSRLAAQVVSGIGFLGAGTILKEGWSIVGLTTAASLWCCAAVGLALGILMWFPAIVGTIFILIVLTVFKKIGKFTTIKQLEVEIEDVTRAEVNELTTVFITSGFRIDQVTVKDHYKTRLQSRPSSGIRSAHPFVNLPRREEAGGTGAGIGAGRVERPKGQDEDKEEKQQRQTRAGSEGEEEEIEIPTGRCSVDFIVSRLGKATLDRVASLIIRTIGPNRDFKMTGQSVEETIRKFFGRNREKKMKKIKEDARARYREEVEDEILNSNVSPERRPNVVAEVLPEDGGGENKESSSSPSHSQRGSVQSIASSSAPDETILHMSFH